MQAASQAYKEEMKKRLRDHSYIRVTIGVINQEAQASAAIEDVENYTYYSNLYRPLNNYEVEELYAACDQDYTLADGSMFFLPRLREDVVLNQGIVTEELQGAVEIHFPVAYDIKGLTVEFGKAYPTEFRIESDNHTIEVTENTSGSYVTDEIFGKTTYIRIVPVKMVNGQSRLRIHQLTMGLGIYFDNRKVLSATKKERISPVMEDLPTVDFELVIENANRVFDVENEESTVNFLEIGQEITVVYGQELDDGNTEWIPGATVYLREWSADDEEMSFSATDRFDGMDGTYYRGEYSAEGISLYDLAVDVFADAGVDSRTYWLDPYLKTVMVSNPIPAVSHKEALQLIAGAGRCILYQDRQGNIYMKSSFVPDMVSGSDNETYFSRARDVLDKGMKQSYAMVGQNYTDAASNQYFLPRKSEEETYLSVGYVSEAVADSEGLFAENPSLEINLEAAYKCFGLTLEFGRNHPQEMVFHAFYGDQLVEDYVAADLQEVTLITHEFPEFDRLVLEFTRGAPHNRVVLQTVTFGDSTDYELAYGTELTKTPKGTQLAKVRELQVIRTLYGAGTEVKELAKETVTLTSVDNRYTFYFLNPAYDLSCIAEGGQAVIVEQSSYYATVEITGMSGACEVAISGKEYVVTQAKVTRQLNTTGSVEMWENPLVSDPVHAADMADWIGDYLRADREYEISYRGDPRIDANDIMFLENKYVPDLLIRAHEHTLKFNGALSGTMKARRDMSYVAAAKNRLARR